MFSIAPRTQAILITVGIFAIGLVCGTIAERRFLRNNSFMRDGGRRGPGGPGPRGGFNAGRPDDRIIDRLSRDLELSEEQQKAVRTAFVNNGKEIDALRRQIGDQMRSQEEKFTDQLKTILTPEQFAKFEERHKRRGFRGRGGGRRGPPGGRPPGSRRGQ